VRLRRTGTAEWRWIGARKAGVRLGGHSHMLAYRFAMHLLPDPDRDRVAVLDKQDTAPPDAFDTTYFPELARAGTTTAVIWNGNQHNVSFMLNSVPVTIVRRDAERAPEIRGTVVPFTMAKALWAPSLEGLREFTAGHPAPASVIVLGTPPPKPDAQIRAGIAVEPHFVQLLAAEGFTAQDAPVTDPSTRVAAWESLQEAMADIAADAGCRFLAVPDEVRTQEGTLRPELCAHDATHANAEYGRIAWRHLLDAVDAGA